MCDKWSNLISNLCQEVYTLLGVDLKPSTSYHHNTSGLVERYNRTLAGLLRATGQDGTDWFSYSVQPRTRLQKKAQLSWRSVESYALPQTYVYSPKLTPRLSLPSAMETVDAITEAEASLSPHTAHALKKRLEIAWDAAAHLTKAAQMSSKERRDLSRRELEYQVGDRVLVRRPVNDRTGVPE